MADINSLINPPDDVEHTDLSSDAGGDASLEQPEKDGPVKNEVAGAGLSVSQGSIVNSFDKIKTHFPAARIKKIMQSDEDIGKVAQATPVVVGRALEIFMANLVEAAIVEAKSAGVRRIAASHIKAAVEKTEQFDFLVDVVSKYQSNKS